MGMENRKDKEEKRYLIDSREQQYPSSQGISYESFSDFFSEKLRELNERSTRKITKREIGVKLDIDAEIFRKYVNKQKITSKRDCIIAICAALELDTTDTNMALHLYGMEELNEENRRDEILMEVLDVQDQNHLSISDINDKLKTEFYPAMDIINHRMTNRNKMAMSHFMLLKKSVECRTNDLAFYDIYDSLETMYRRFPTVHANMWLDKNGQKLVKLYADSTGEMYYQEYSHENNNLMIGSYEDIAASLDANGETYYQEYSNGNDKKLMFGSPEELDALLDAKYRRFPTFHADKNSEFHMLDSLNDDEDASELKEWFIELQEIVRIENFRRNAPLNDTRNYHERVSARIINNDIHVFYETYNYIAPELGEYYLMDYSGGKFTLSVSNRSRFMRLYLSEQEYDKHFGKKQKGEVKEYTSIDDIDSSAKAAPIDRQDIIKLRINAFNRARDKILDLVSKLKAGGIHIRNLEMIYENEYDVLKYYNVTAKYKCICDSEYGEIEGVGVDKAKFTLTDNTQVELSIEDLINGFKLGLSSVEEIGKFLLEHKSLIINNLL